MLRATRYATILLVAAAIAAPAAVAVATTYPWPSECTAEACLDLRSVDGGCRSTTALTVEVVAIGDNIGGTQNDILFDTSVVNLSGANKCVINFDIGTAAPGCAEDPPVGPCKNLSRNLANCGVSPSAPGCEGQPPTVSRFRGIV